MMMVVVGLGNPGKKYEGNRHNVGYMVVERLAEKERLIFSRKGKLGAEVAKGEGMILIKPLEYMNKSGLVVSRVKNFYKAELDDLYVVFDDLDLRLGEFKIQKGKGPKDHKGLLSVEEQLGEEGFWRVRVGVDNRGERQMEGRDYVLSDFEEEEKKEIEIVIEEVVNKLSSK